MSTVRSLRLPVRAAPDLSALGLTALALRVALAGTLSVSAEIHAQLYIDGYRFIHDIGVMFLLQASVSFAVAALILFAAPLVLQAAAAGTALGALAGFVISRTVGLYGFTERGLQPAPQSLLSILAECATLVLLAVLASVTLWQRRTRGARREAGATTAEV
jgi:hypothetical protein